MSFLALPTHKVSDAIISYPRKIKIERAYTNAILLIENLMEGFKAVVLKRIELDHQDETYKWSIIGSFEESNAIIYRCVGFYKSKMYIDTLMEEMQHVVLEK